MARVKPLTARTLHAVGPRQAAAYFIARRSEGLTQSEEQLLEDWLAADVTHQQLLASAERAWRAFDEPGDARVLNALRADSLALRPRMGPRGLLTPLNTAILVLIGLALLAAIASAARWAAT